MSEFFKSKLGMFLAGIYSSFVICSLILYGLSPPEIMSEFALLILTMPWSFVFLVMIEILGMVTKENYFVLCESVVEKTDKQVD